jgi:hypothetical protein
MTTTTTTTTRPTLIGTVTSPDGRVADYMIPCAADVVDAIVCHMVKVSTPTWPGPGEVADLHPEMNRPTPGGRYLGRF